MDDAGCTSDADADRLRRPGDAVAGASTAARRPSAWPPRAARLDDLDRSSSRAPPVGSAAPTGRERQHHRARRRRRSPPVAGRAQARAAVAFLDRLQYGCGSPAGAAWAASPSRPTTRSTTARATPTCGPPPVDLGRRSAARRSSRWPRTVVDGDRHRRRCRRRPPPRRARRPRPTTTPSSTVDPTSSGAPDRGRRRVRPVDAPSTRRATGSLAQTGTDLLAPALLGLLLVVVGGLAVWVELAPPGGARLMRRPARRFVARLAGAAAASGLALAGLVVAAAPASAAACSGTTGVTVVVDTGRLDQHQVRLGRPVVGAEGADVRRVLGRLPAAVPRVGRLPDQRLPGVRPVRADAAGRRLLGLLPRQARRQLGLQLERRRELRPRPGLGRRLPVRLGPAARHRSPGAHQDQRADPDEDHPEAEAEAHDGDPRPTTPKAARRAEGHLGVDLVDARRQAAPTAPAAQGASSRSTVRHALGERHGIRLGEPAASASGTRVGEPERDGIRPRGRADVRRRRRRRRRPGHPPRRCRPRGAGRRRGRLGCLETTRLTR